MVSQLKRKADGASGGGSLLAEMSWIYRNKTEKNYKIAVFINKHVGKRALICCFFECGIL